MNEVQIGFSTRKYNPLAALIRLMTKSKVSHTWLLYMDKTFGIQMVLEATVEGVRISPYDKFNKKNQIIAIIDPRYSIEKGLISIKERLGDKYNFMGLFGMFFVIVGRWFKRKVKNPLHDPNALYCSELVTEVLQNSDYPGSEQLGIETTSPKQLYDFLSKVKII